MYSGDGVLRQVADATATAGAIAYDTLVADVLSARPRNEVVVDLYSPTDKSAIQVFSQVGGLLTVADTKVDNSTRTHKISLAAGDVTAEGDTEIIAANAGEFTGTTAFRHTDPSIDIYKQTGGGDKLNGVTRRQVGGAEMANDAPALVVADLGYVGKSRHPVDASASAAHNSTEVAGFAPHVDCSDCHNVHDSTTATAAAPFASGPLKGAWGVSIENAPATFITYTEKQGVDRQYEICLKCHSGWTPLPGRRNIASEVDTRNPSFHAVEGASSASNATASSFTSATPAWTNDSVLYCTDCHDQSDPAAARGPHSSSYSSLLKKPYFGASSNNPDVLCYSCHKETVYYDGSEDGIAASTSHFYNTAQAGQGEVAKKHRLHVLELGLVCDTCHASHGSRHSRISSVRMWGTRMTRVGAAATTSATATPARRYSYRSTDSLGPRGRLRDDVDLGPHFDSREEVLDVPHVHTHAPV